MPTITLNDGRKVNITKEEQNQIFNAVRNGYSEDEIQALMQEIISNYTSDYVTTTHRSDNRNAKSNKNYHIRDNAGNDYTFDFTTNASEGVKDKKTAAVLEYIIKNGSIPSNKELVNMPGEGNFSRAVRNAQQVLAESGYTIDDIRNNLMSSGQNIYDNEGRDISNQFYDIDADGKRIIKQEYQTQINENARTAEESAYDDYWNNLYSRNESTLGAEAYDNLLQAEQSAGRDAIDLANAQAQQLGMAQAATVKNITDSLKAERMARLRAGMSESQIASQDMQTMIANTNALNEQIAASNIAAMQGQQQINNAETTAYQNWLNSMNQTATGASAFAAADAGNADQQARLYALRTKQSYANSHKQVTGNGSGGK